MDQTRLATMANQIADFFGAQRSGAEEAIADHIAKNWDPRMRAGIFALLEAGGTGLTPLARAAVERLAASRAGA